MLLPLREVGLAEQLKLQHRLRERLKSLATRLCERRGREVGPERIRQVQVEWTELFAQVQAEIDAGTDPNSAKARELARRWDDLVAEFTGGDAGITASLGGLYSQEPDVAARYGMNPALLRAYGFFFRRCDHCGGEQRVLAVITDPTATQSLPSDRASPRARDGPPVSRAALSGPICTRKAQALHGFLVRPSKPPQNPTPHPHSDTLDRRRPIGKLLWTDYSPPLAWRATISRASIRIG